MLALDIAPYIVPAPPAVARAFAEMPDYFLSHARITLMEALAGLGCAIVTALLLGVILAASRRVERALYPALLVLSAIPKPAVAPLLITIGGFGSGPKIALVWMMCFFPVAMATLTGLTSTPAELVELARSLDASRWRTFVKVRLPAALPRIFVGVRTALPLSVIGAVVAELFGAVAGLGYVIRSAGTDASIAFAAVALLSVMSITLFYLLAAVEQRIIPWIHHTHV
ncbi:ABC transporter permease [Micromonospora sp. WMMD1082]|uniref:ABC transporter permease n=1 Tax=Micromonospora sp. WMMD1082 TaxID=3016104 RepID=UPI0024180205|nr:ABC transporter permease [Micromonospora sp. WMMD1082]MDG4795125.1 ABC transporter permease [Micromonospora sp. WMMD1082]